MCECPLFGEFLLLVSNSNMTSFSGLSGEAHHDGLAEKKFTS